MKWFRKSISDGVSNGMTQGLGDFLRLDLDRAKPAPIPVMPTALEDRIKWAAALWRDAKRRSSSEAPSIFGQLVAAGEQRVLARLLVDWDAERKAAKAMEARQGQDPRGLDGDSHDSAGRRQRHSSGYVTTSGSHECNIGKHQALKDKDL